MDLNIVLDKIVNEVLIRLQNRPKRALILFTGASIGFPDAIEQLKILIEDGWQFKVLLSNSAEYVLTQALVQKELNIEEIYLESSVTSMKSLYADTDCIIIPTLTFNTAVKISLGIADTLVTNIVAHAIMEDIPILAAKDACDLENPIRRQLGMNKIPNTYLNMAADYLKTLSSYGIKLVDAVSIAHHAKVLNSFTSTTAMPVSISKRIEINKKVISRADIINAAAAGDTLVVMPKAIFTSLAQDAAKDYDIKIVSQER
ncbi:Flavoprotein [Geosporobacter subterraneus DSM 17957]|uniref:Flavoprotein n=1 Tax=Geosporobacter subterraneus DSM 17957 TaxID=1121919 RepID=A0A1M6HU65_9FIRM|nr:flavoprotein [Geosporobacter subterraneus]SHJ25745.1 Flavoprotein [Geosporobacter subterraneus DSM 17957]